MNKNRIIVVHDQENHEFIQFPVYGNSWERATGSISGEGAETQLANALAVLGFVVYESVTDQPGPSRQAAPSDLGEDPETD